MHALLIEPVGTVDTGDAGGDMTAELREIISTAFNEYSELETITDDVIAAAASILVMGN